MYHRSTYLYCSLTHSQYQSFVILLPLMEGQSSMMTILLERDGLFGQTESHGKKRENMIRSFVHTN